MNYKVLFQKRSTEPEYELGTFSSYTMASLVAKGEYYYRGGVTPDYRIIESTEAPERIPEHLYDVLVQAVGFLSTEEQEVFRDEHFKYLRRKGLV